MAYEARYLVNVNVRMRTLGGKKYVEKSIVKYFGVKAGRRKS